MAVKGATEKQIIIDKILEVFDGSFIYNGGKEIRIPIDDVQIKVTFTCAKENVTPADETRLPGEAGSSFPDPVTSVEEKTAEPADAFKVKASEEEIALVNKLMKDLNL